jgi:hypothetical protein
MTDLDSFGIAFCSWRLPRQVEFLRDAGNFLARVGRLDINENERRVQLKLAHLNLSPLFLNNLEEPGRQIASALQAAADINVTCVEKACRELLKQPLDAVDPESLTEILDLLVKAEFSSGEHIANEAIERLTRIHTDFLSRERYAAAAIYIIGLAAGGYATVAAVERLRKHGLNSLAIAEAALRMVASLEPSALRFALKTLERDLESSDSASLDCVAALIDELVDRSDALSVLVALAGLNPASHPKLFRAAIVINPDAGPFALFRLIDPFSSGHRLILTTTEGRFEIDDLLKGTVAQASGWKTTLIKTLGFTPRDILDVGNILESHSQDEGMPKSHVFAGFMQQLGVSDPLMIAKIPVSGHA